MTDNEKRFTVSRRGFLRALGVAAAAPVVAAKAVMEAPASPAVIAVNRHAGALTVATGAWESGFSDGDYLFIQGDFGRPFEPLPIHYSMVNGWMPR
jgi:hypothetical protein